LEANRPQLEPRHHLCHRPAVAHPSATFVSLRFQCRKGTYGARFKRHFILISFFKSYVKSETAECLYLGRQSVHLFIIYLFEIITFSLYGAIILSNNYRVTTVGSFIYALRSGGRNC
jgi:hypothetical protein